MLTVKEAYKICKKHNIGKEACAAVDYGDYYLFNMKSKIGRNNVSGTFMDAINKNNGEHVLYNILNDTDDNIIPVKIDLKEIGL